MVWMRKTKMAKQSACKLTNIVTQNKQISKKLLHAIIYII